MHEEVSVPELTEAIARLSALLGPRQGGVLLLEGGITKRNYRVTFGGTAYVVRLSGKDTELLGIDREAERLATRRAAELELGPRVAATLDEPACLVTVFVESREVPAEELRRPGSLGAIARGLRAFHESARGCGAWSRAPSPTPTSTSRATPAVTSSGWPGPARTSASAAG
ncbi:MAG: hypothetical protein ACRDL0_12260 [Thermoleophilaceae bacterium]